MTETQDIHLTGIFAQEKAQVIPNQYKNVTLNILSTGLSWVSADGGFSGAASWQQVFSANTALNEKGLYGTAAWSIEVTLTNGYNVKFLIPTSIYPENWASSIQSYLNYYKSLYPTPFQSAQQPTDASPQSQYPTYYTSFKAASAAKPKGKNYRPFLVIAIVVVIIIGAIVAYFKFSSSGSLTGPSQSETPAQIANQINLTYKDFSSTVQENDKEAISCYSSHNPLLCGNQNPNIEACLNSFTDPSNYYAIVGSPVFSQGSLSVSALFTQSYVIVAQNFKIAQGYYSNISSLLEFKCFTQINIFIFGSAGAQLVSPNITYSSVSVTPFQDQAKAFESQFSLSTQTGQINLVIRQYFFQAGRLITLLNSIILGSDTPSIEAQSVALLNSLQQRLHAVVLQ